jgi:hypothetical protein
VVGLWRDLTDITKSICPSSLTVLSTAASRLLTSRTSTPPIPMTFAPGLCAARSAATRSVFSTFRPMMQAFAPRWTRARTWALQMLPAPPVQKTTLFSERESCQYEGPETPSGFRHTEKVILPHIRHVLRLCERHDIQLNPRLINIKE